MIVGLAFILLMIVAIWMVQDFDDNALH